MKNKWFCETGNIFTKNTHYIRKRSLQNRWDRGVWHNRCAWNIIIRMCTSELKIILPRVASEGLSWPEAVYLSYRYCFVNNTFSWFNPVSRTNLIHHLIYCHSILVLTDLYKDTAVDKYIVCRHNKEEARLYTCLSLCQYRNSYYKDKNSHNCLIFIMGIIYLQRRPLYENRAQIHPPVLSIWRHQMKTFSALLAICAGNSPVPGEFPTQRPVTRSFDVFFHLRLNKRLSKQWWGWWFETLSGPLWRHCNGTLMIVTFWMLSRSELDTEHSGYLYLMVIVTRNKPTISWLSCVFRSPWSKLP